MMIDKKRNFFLLFLLLVNIHAVKSQGELNITLKIIPDNPAVTDDIYVEGKVNATGDIAWYWTINKEPNDFEDYPDDASKRDLYKGTGTTCKIGPIKRSKPGDYKLYVGAVQGGHRQKWITRSISVASNDGIISVGIRGGDCMDDGTIVLAKGSKIKLYDYARVLLSPQESAKFDGIQKIQWLYKNGPAYETLAKSYSFNTIIGLEDNNYNKPYRYGDNTHCFDLSYVGYSIQEVYITLKAWGGKMEYKNGIAQNPLKLVSNTNPVSYIKKIIVVDTNRVLNLPTSIPNSDITEPNITFNSTFKITDNSTQKYQAYGDIIMEPGFEVKQGATFTAKALETKPLLLDCDCQYVPTTSLSNKRKEIPEEDDETTTIGELSENDIKGIYPNPTKGIIYMDTFTNYSAELYDLEGRKVGSFYNESYIDISHLNNGVYLLKLHTNREIENHKIVLNK